MAEGGSPVVIHVNTARDWRGGERQTLLLVLGQLRAGLDIRVATPPGSVLAERLLGEGIPADRLHRFPMRGEVDPVAIARLALLCRRFGAGILHLHTAHAHALGVAAAALTGTRTVVARRVDYPMAPGLLSRIKYRRADAYVAISEAVRRILLLDGVPEDRIHLVRSGVRVPPLAEVRALKARRVELRAARAIPPDATVILNVGSLVDHKGQEILPEAARILPGDHRVLIVGDGPLRKTLEDAITRNGASDRVLLLGHQTELAPLYALADVYVQPSTSEGLGTAMLDAMAFELPIVGTHAGGIPEAVRHEENGLLLSGRNPYVLGEAMKRLGEERELSERLGTRGRAIVEEEFSEERMVRETTEVYAKVMAKSPSPVAAPQNVDVG